MISIQIFMSPELKTPLPASLPLQLPPARRPAVLRRVPPPKPSGRPQPHAAPHRSTPPHAATVIQRRHCRTAPVKHKVLLFEVWCCVLDAKEMLKNVLGRFVSKGVCGYGGMNSRPPCVYVPASYFRSGQPHSAPRSFFGVEDYLDDDNSRPYTYQKEKKSKNPHKHISFKQRTVAFMEPFTLDIFISKRFVQASITHRVTCKQVAVAGTNSKDIKAALPSRCDIPACLAVGRFLAERAREADVYTASYTPRERDKFEGKIRAVVQSIIDNGIDIKVYLD